MFMHSVERKSSGSAFHRVGPVRENERRPYRTRMYRGTTSNARSADRRARHGTYGGMREAKYVVIRSCKARNTITSILYSMRYFTGSQCSCGNAAVMLRRSPRLIRRTTLAAERCTISRQMLLSTQHVSRYSHRIANGFSDFAQAFPIVVPQKKASQYHTKMQFVMVRFCHVVMSL